MYSGQLLCTVPWVAHSHTHTYVTWTCVRDQLVACLCILLYQAALCICARLYRWTITRQRSSTGRGCPSPRTPGWTTQDTYTLAETVRETLPYTIQCTVFIALWGWTSNLLNEWSPTEFNKLLVHTKKSWTFLTCILVDNVNIYLSILSGTILCELYAWIYTYCMCIGC